MKDSTGLSPTEASKRAGGNRYTGKTREERDAATAASGFGLRSLQARAEQLGARSIADLPGFVLTSTVEAALLLGRPTKQLEAWRARGLGPRWIKRGRRIGYPLAELRRFAALDGGSE